MGENFNWIIKVEGNEGTQFRYRTENIQMLRRYCKRVLTDYQNQIGNFEARFRILGSQELDFELRFYDDRMDVYEILREDTFEDFILDDNVKELQITLWSKTVFHWPEHRDNSPNQSTIRNETFVDSINESSFLQEYAEFDIEYREESRQEESKIEESKRQISKARREMNQYQSPLPRRDLIPLEHSLSEQHAPSTPVQLPIVYSTSAPIADLQPPEEEEKIIDKNPNFRRGAAPSNSEPNPRPRSLQTNAVQKGPQSSNQAQEQRQNQIESIEDIAQQSEILQESYSDSIVGSLQLENETFIQHNSRGSDRKAQGNLKLDTSNNFPQ